jgi:NADPH:quinone reductase
MKALVFDRFGEPCEVLQLQDVVPSDPGPGQACVRMLLSPINMSDLLVVRGVYGRLPTLPATPGFEGVGVVEAVGPGFLAKLRGLKPGRRVAVLNSAGGNWREQVVLPARQLVPLADDLPDEQAAMFFVNPASALVMTRSVLQAQRGQWLAQTAAASAVGQMVIRLGRHFGFRTINIVRRAEQAEALRKDGAEHVIDSSSEPVPERVRAISGGGAQLALDAVGGAIGQSLVESLAASGKMLVYGTLASEPIPLQPRSLMVGHKTIEGFWLSDWIKQQSILRMLKLFREIQDLMRRKILITDVGGVYALGDFQRGLTQAQSSRRSGKILLRLTNGPQLKDGV